MSLPCSVIPCHSLRISQRRRWTHFLRIALRMWGFYGSGFSFRKIPLQSDGEGDASCSLPAFWLVYSSFCYLPPPPALAQQVKKSNHRHSGCWVPTPELCLWWRCGVSSPSRASPACPASFSLCSKQREAPAAEGKEDETVPQPGVHLYLTVWPYPPLNTHLTAAPPFLLILLLCIRLLMRFLMKCEGSENT